ncbi:transient receptor potential cation channel subfamily A member 1-like [Anneissia japonica]|uniref:transient receptor potential cation channel subfamily A member 1-like n=1 Tax=Anneissia japonica TaxID=1529436 RepID=UPI0014255B13|nr:transient receptor potential cation channel subfamily A member 1-like [Anneissia japonica]
MSDVAFIEGGVECTPLHITSLHQQIADEGISTGRQDSYPLHFAAAHSSVTTFKYLVEKACSLKSAQHELMRLRDNEGFTPLHSAVSSGSLEMVECCLQYGSPIELTENTGHTALHMACAQGSPNIVEILLNSEDGCKVIDHKSFVGQTALHTAAKYNHIDVAKVLIKRGCKLDEKDNDGLTPLLLGCFMDSWQTSWLLLEHGASLTNTDAKGRNLLHFVVYKASTIISMPISLYKSVERNLSSLVNVQDIDGNSPLHCAVEYGGSNQVHRMLYLGGAPWLHNNQLQTPFHIAAALGRSDCIQIMMKTPSKLSINQVGLRNQTPVHQAAGNGHVEVVRILLKSGAITRGDLFGQTPFHASAKGGHTEVARELLTLRSRSMLNELDKLGNTALHLAAMEDHPHMVSFLLTEHAQLIPNAKGDYVFDVATDSLNRKATIALTLHDRWCCA